jgi:hypothetical protein
MARVRAARTAFVGLLNAAHLARKEFNLEDRILFRLAEDLLPEETLRTLDNGLCD